MKDAKGHGSNPRGAHAEGIDQFASMPHAKRDPSKPMYMRFGSWDPNHERSKINAENGLTHEKGLSVYALDGHNNPVASAKVSWGKSDLDFRLKREGPPIFVQGDKVGEGYDGEPLLRNVRAVG